MANRRKKKQINLMVMISGISGAVILSLLLIMLFTGKSFNDFKDETLNSSESGGGFPTQGSAPEWRLPDSASLKFKNVLQNPELPTGCEITALTAVLNYYGYDVDKMYMAENYLELGQLYKDSFSEKFIGEPWDKEGYGCYAPVIFDSASRFLKDNNSPFNVYNISGQDLTVLFAEVSKGHPVLVWTNMNLTQSPQIREITMEDGSVEKWIVPEHCVVLIGYDYVSNTVEIADPLGNFEKVDMENFNKRYVEHLRQALVIK